MRVAVKGGVDPSDELVGGEQPCGLGDPALPRDPLGLDGVQPRALDRKLAGDDADAAPTPLDAAVVGTDPGAYGSAAVPGGVVADQQQRLRAGGLESGPAPGQVFSRDGAARAASDEAPPGLLLPPARVGCRAEQQAVAGQRLGVRSILRDRLLAQPARLVGLDPPGQGRRRQATPPDLVLEAQAPGRRARRQADQAVATTVFGRRWGQGG
jgi:hypothetical protein